MLFDSITQKQFKSVLPVFPQTTRTKHKLILEFANKTKKIVD